MLAMIIQLDLFSQLGINGSLHMTIQTGMLIETGQLADEGPCTGCPVGRFSEAGSPGCLEMLSAFLAGPPEPALNATGGSFGVAHLAAELGAWPWSSSRVCGWPTQWMWRRRYTPCGRTPHAAHCGG